MAITTEECEELEEKKICAGCIGETYLSNCVEREGEEDECSYCGEELECITLEELADRVEAAFETHYSRTSDEPNSYQSAMQRDKEIDYDWDREGQQTVYAIADAANVSNEIAEDIQASLEYRHYDFENATMGVEDEFSPDAHYEEIMPGDHEWQEQWTEFVRLIKTEARFFSRTAASHLSDLFDRIDEMRTHDGRSLVMDVGPDTELTHLFRGRVFQSEPPLQKAMERPDIELAAPPASAAGAGRMNARGISAFYGATAPDIVLAEVRPPVGSWVAMARFEITRPLRLLDLTALADIHEHGSIFDPDYAYRLGRMMFLRTLSGRMARPVMPEDQEMEYLPTQALADYLSTEGQVPLDGILFPSVQVGGNGMNAVLFHKSSLCERLDIPEGTEISSRSYTNHDDGPEPDFHVSEEVPPAEDEPETDERRPGIFEPVLGDWDEWFDADLRDAALRIDVESLRVHEVNAVQIDTNSHPVRRHRFEKHDYGF